MQDINSVVVIGRLTRDPELKYTGGGAAVMNFSVAVNDVKKQGDEYVEEAHFFDVNLWGRQAEAVIQYMTKGKQIAVYGKLRQDRWEQDGQKRSKVKIKAHSVQLLGSKSDGQSHSSESSGGAGENTFGGTAPENFEDEIPF